MSHFNFYRTDTSNGKKFFKFHARKIDDPKIVFNGDGTVSWKDHLSHTQLFGGVAPKYTVVPSTFDQSKQDCEDEAKRQTDQYVKFGWEELPSH